MKVEKWVDWQQANALEEAGIGGMGGWFAHGHRWHDYIDQYDIEQRPYVEALRQSIIEKKIKHGGDWHQNDLEGAPVFEDGKSVTYSYRAWGDLLAAIWSTEENKDYQYMDFYMGDW